MILLKILKLKLESTHSTNLHQAKTCQKLYFILKLLNCQIAKFGEDKDLNHGQAITTGRFILQQFWPWPLTLTSEKLIVWFGRDAQHLWQISWNSREMTMSFTNEPTNKQSNSITIPPGGRKYWSINHCNQTNLGITEEHRIRKQRVRNDYQDISHSCTDANITDCSIMQLLVANISNWCNHSVQLTVLSTNYSLHFLKTNGNAYILNYLETILAD